MTIEILFALALVKFDEHSRSAPTDLAAGALYGVALATLDDDPGVRPDAHAFIVDKALWFTVTDDRIPGQNASPQFLAGRSHAIAACAATLSVCWSFGEGTFAGKRGNGQDAPFPAIRR